MIPEYKRKRKEKIKIRDTKNRLKLKEKMRNDPEYEKEIKEKIKIRNAKNRLKVKEKMKNDPEYKKKIKEQIRLRRAKITQKRIEDNKNKMISSLEKDEKWENIKTKEYSSYYITSHGKVYNKEFVRVFGCINAGYLYVCLTGRDGKSICKNVHRLVCITFNGEPPSEDKNIVDHIDRNKINNKKDNLRWVNVSENAKNRSAICLTEEAKAIQHAYMNLKKDDEEFKVIENSPYGNYTNYSVSNYGRIKNNETEILLKPNLHWSGYLRIGLK